QDHAQVAAFRQKRRVIPEAIQVDVVTEGRRFLPRFDDSIESQHQTTSTRGTFCFAASYRLLYFSDFARIRRNAGSLFVTQWPKVKPPMKTATPASRLLKRLKAPTAPTQTK